MKKKQLKNIFNHLKNVLFQGKVHKAETGFLTILKNVLFQN